MFAIGAERWAGISKLVEEAGEVVQVCGKLFATYGEIAHWEGSDLRTRLEEEIGDVLAAVEFVIEKNPILSREKIQVRRAEKLALFRTWHLYKTADGE